ncbi:MAG: hypothetical protein C0478_08655 [Planctomyces sp.]|jgi:hypothetical protein|nr:hypothetical protein [Planctomyces sp.]
MKIGCPCGASIIDQTDKLPYKAHLIPDQAWLATFDAIDEQIIDPLAGGKLTKEAAYHQARLIIGHSARSIWQCRACGRLHIDGLDGQLQCFVPAGPQANREVLSARPS